MSTIRVVRHAYSGMYQVQQIVGVHNGLGLYIHWQSWHTTPESAWDEVRRAGYPVSTVVEEEEAQS